MNNLIWAVVAMFFFFWLRSIATKMDDYFGNLKDKIDDIHSRVTATYIDPKDINDDDL